MALPDLAKVASPDSLACFLSLAVIICLLKKSPGLFAVAATLPLARTDFVLLSLLLSCAAFFLMSRKLSVISAVVSVLIYVGINRLNDNYGYLVILNFTLMNRDPYPDAMQVSTHVYDYLRFFWRGMQQSVNNLQFPIFFLVFASLGTRLARKRRLHGIDHAAIVALAFIVSHLALFPIYLDRFFSFAAAVSLIYLVSIVHAASLTPASERANRIRK